MSEEKREGTFIPCGDSFERMAEIKEESLENVTGGYFGEEYAPDCEKCGTRTHFIIKGVYYYYDCPNCGHSVPVPF